MLSYAECSHYKLRCFSCGQNRACHGGNCRQESSSSTKTQNFCKCSGDLPSLYGRSHVAHITSPLMKAPLPESLHAVESCLLWEQHQQSLLLHVAISTSTILGRTLQGSMQPGKSRFIIQIPALQDLAIGCFPQSVLGFEWSLVPKATSPSLAGSTSRPCWLTIQTEPLPGFDSCIALWPLTMITRISTT